MQDQVDTLWINADKRVRYRGASRADTGAYLNDGTCTYALKDSAGNTVTGGTGTLTYTASSNGDYAATIDRAVTTLLVADATYYLEVTFAKDGFDDFRRLECVAKYRGRR